MVRLTARRARRIFAAVVATAAAFASLGASSSSAAITCTKTQNPGESVSSFVSRLGTNEEGCLLAGTYPVGNLTNFKLGQTLHPAPTSGGGYQPVTLKGTLSANVDNLTIDDMQVRGVPGTGNGKVVEILHCNNCRFDHLDITVDTPGASSPTQGFLNLYPTTGLQITNNKIHGIGDDGQFDHGIYCDQSTGNGRIEGNWIYDNGAFGIQFYPNCDDVDFAHNVLDGNGALAWCSLSSPNGGGCGSSTTNGRGLTFSGEGTQHSDNVVAHNNVLSTFGGAGFALISCYQPGSGDAIKDSLLYQSSGSDDTCGSSISRSGDIHGQNPLYVDRLSHDYRLQAASPARALMGSYADAVPGPRLDSSPPPPPADTTPPDTSIGSGPTGSTTSTSASFSFSSSESGSSFECRLDGGAWGSCSSPKSYSSLAVGSHTFEVRATDTAGNTD
ncbi:MAG: right-handed parallel beta-helix repeat-containing protein, partial [Thermoleophilaceae bacterium]